MTRALVTGATGFIGSHLARALVERGDEVVVLRRPGSSLLRLELAGVLEGVEVAEASLSGGSNLDAAIQRARPDVVFHLAAQGVRAGTENDASMVETNVLGGMRLVEACNGASVERVVWMGSCSEYAPAFSPLREDAPTRPVTWYGATKLAGWELARAIAARHGLAFVTVRLFSAYGSMEHPSRFIPYVMTQLLRGLPVEMTTGEQLRDYLHVDDVARALITLADAPGTEGEVFNLGSGVPRSVRDLAVAIARLAPGDADLRVGTLARKRPEPDFQVADPSKLGKLGWFPGVPLAAGLARTLQWYVEHRSSWDRLP